MKRKMQEEQKQPQKSGTAQLLIFCIIVQRASATLLELKMR
jgi:hypothetical protein